MRPLAFWDAAYARSQERLAATLARTRLTLLLERDAVLGLYDLSIGGREKAFAAGHPAPAPVDTTATYGKARQAYGGGPMTSGNIVMTLKMKGHK